MSTARVVVFGYGRLALAALDTFARLGVTPAAVVVPGNREGVDVDMVVARAAGRGLRLLVQPKRAELAPFLDAIRAIAPDVLFVWSYTMLLPAELIALAPKGAVNMHGGMLPGYRGGHVMNWTLINGEQESAATLHYLDAGIDTGPVIAEHRFPLDWRDDITSVQVKLQDAGERLLEHWWPAIADGTAPRTPQDESRAVYHRLRTADDGQVDWTRSNVEIYNLVRALTAPWPGARTWCGERQLVLRRVEPMPSLDDPAVAPGTVVRCRPDDVRVASGAGDVQLRAVEVNGSLADHRTLSAAGLAVGVRLR